MARWHVGDKLLEGEAPRDGLGALRDAVRDDVDLMKGEIFELVRVRRTKQEYVDQLEAFNERYRPFVVAVESVAALENLRRPAVHTGCSPSSRTGSSSLPGEAGNPRIGTTSETPTDHAPHDPWVAGLDSAARGWPRQCRQNCLNHPKISDQTRMEFKDNTI